jgi:hypothetical protein
MPTTYVSLAKNTLGSATDIVSFNSFSGYTDLVLIVRTRPTTNNLNAYKVTVNNDSTNTYWGMTNLSAIGSTDASTRTTNEATARFFQRQVGYNECGLILHIMNYASANTFKTIISKTFSDRGAHVEYNVNTRRDNAAITSLELFWDPTGNKHKAGDTFELYGILCA